MSISDFHRKLKSSAAGPGATWKKADFHIHAPGSSDYEYRGPDAIEQLGTAIAQAGLSYAVILKHEAMPGRAALEALQDYCPHTTLIPGAEINVFVDTLFKQVTKDHFFHCIVAVDPKDTRDYNFVIEAAKVRFSYRDGAYPSGFRSSISDLGQFFKQEGALFMPAHLHQGKDPSSSRSIDDIYDDDAFLGFVGDRTFTALEVRDSRTAKFFDGNSVTATNRSIPGCVCVASSDAHHHEHIATRSRCTWVRAEHPTFAELKAALAFGHRVALAEPTRAHAHIVGLHVEGAFVPHCWLHLSEGLNALIGSKGSGKTALLECLRFVLATPVPSERQESVGRHLQHILGSGGYVECLVRHADQSETLITRRMDSAGRLTLLSGDGTTRSVPSTEGTGFPVSILGWHEIEAVADDPSARIGLLDRVDDPAIVRNAAASIQRSIERARDIMPSLQRQIKRLDGSLRVLWDLKRKRRTLAKLEEGALSVLQRDYEEFLLLEQQLERLRKTVQATAESVTQRVRSDLTAEIFAPREGSPASAGETQLLGVAESVREIARLEDSAIRSIEEGVSSADSLAAAAAARLAELFGEFRDKTYTPQVNALPTEEREILARQIQVLEETKRLPSAEAEVEELLKEVRGLASDVHAACEDVRSYRNAIVSHREELVHRINGELESVRVTFQRSANRSAQQRFQSRHGAEGGGLLAYMGSFAGAEAYDRLSSLFASLRELDVAEEKFEVKDVLFDVKAADLFDIVDDDDITIELRVGVAGFVPVQRLSAGQRCVAVFPLLLRDTRGPLIIDQPEDNLDNRYIADAIAPDLLRKKARQQFLVTSHNANLVVLTDAELIVHVDSDGATSSMPAAGFLSCGESPVKQSVLDVLDGGEAALSARQRKYGLGGGA